MQSREVLFVEYAKLLIESDVRSRKDVLADLGRDIREVDASNSRDMDRLDELRFLHVEEAEHLEWEPDDDVVL